MSLIVQKYGGSSLASPRHIQRAAARIKALKQSGKDVVVVVSAMGHTTDHLIKLAKRTVRRPPSREMDMLLTAGERVSMSLLAMSLQESGVPAISFTGSQSGIQTTSEHMRAKISDIRPQRIQEELTKGKVVIIAGFQGVSKEKEITTLGRGGSDTTAVALAAVLGAESCEILTDVKGLYSADPRIVPQARLLPWCSYDESLEMASLGAKMQPRSIELAKRRSVRVVIGSSQDNAGEGTVISSFPGEKNVEASVVKGIATQDGYHFFRTDLALSALIGAFKARQVAVRFVQSAERATAFLVDEENVVLATEALDAVGAQYSTLAAVSLVSAVGDGIASSSDILPRFMETLESTGAECLLLSTGTLSVTAAVSDKHKAQLAADLHRELVEQK